LVFKLKNEIWSIFFTFLKNLIFKKTLGLCFVLCTNKAFANFVCNGLGLKVCFKPKLSLLALVYTKHKLAVLKSTSCSSK
jgi:hypothetical protein